MKAGIRKALAALFVLYSLTGCQTTRVDLLRKGTVHLETISEGRSSITSVFVYQTDRTMTVTGEIRNLSRNTRTGYVLVEVLGPDGAYWAQKNVPVVPTLWLHKNSRRPRFEAVFPGTIPDGAVIRMRHERKS